MKHTLSIGLLFLLNIANAQINVPEKIIGNWINDKNNNWEYGFFEAFAVYDNDFWEYEHVEVKNNQVWVKLKKGFQTENLKITTQKNIRSLIIANNKGKARYKLDNEGSTPYATPDHKSFKNSGFKSDTVTIIGYYRNLGKYLETARNEHQKGPFQMSVPDFIQEEEAIYYADFDSLGRFTVKFPVLNTQEVFLDWGRLTQTDVVEPGETIFLFADLADYIEQENWIEFRKKPRQILYMGDEARLHNELANYRPSVLYFDRQETVRKKVSDLDYLNAAKSTYETRLRHLEDYIKRNPAVSDRFRVFQHAHEKYRMLFDLMQHSFDKRDEDIVFDEGYMEFVNSIMEVSDETHFTLIRDYATVIRDYTGYYEDVGTAYKDEQTGEIKLRGPSVTDADVLMDMKTRRAFSKHEEEIISKYSEMHTVVFPKIAALKGDTAKIAKLFKGYEKTSFEAGDIIERLGIKDSLPELRKQLLSKKMRTAEFLHIDTLVRNETLQQLLMAQAFNQSMEHTQVPLSQADLNLLRERVKIQPLYDYVMTVNNYYVTLSNKQLSYLSSLKNTDHLKEAKDAEVLFQELTSPYKGKVIYLDFWGTWCGPCKEQMSYVGAVKKELEGRDVIFMYLANNSPEKSWSNVIKQLNLTGENVVHYRLPAEQQAMIERKFSVQSYPTYLLFGKDGNLVRDDAPPPEQKSELIDEINKLLK